MEKPIRILICDDHAVVREGLRALIATEADIDVVGEATDGEKAVAAYRALTPDVTLLDMVMPRMDGLTAIRIIKSEYPDARILVLTSFAEDDMVFRAIKSGALGYLLKDSLDSDLVLAVRAVARGDGYLSPSVSEAVLSDYRKHVTDPVDLLTSREREILQQIAEGKTNKEIAVTLNISVYTVDAHRGRIMEKLNLHSAGELVRFALRKGLID